MKKYLVLLSVVLLFSSCSLTGKYGQKKLTLVSAKNVKIDETAQGERIGPCEPSIAINPTNKNNVVAAAVLNRVYHSFDGGLHWTKDIATSPYGVYGDPVLVADPSGNFYYSHLSDPSGKGWADATILDRMVIQKSEDGGRSWSDGSYAGYRHPKDQDKQWMYAHPTDGTLYMTWTEFDKYGDKSEDCHSRILFSKSMDKGLSWTEAKTISNREGDCIDDDNTTEGATPVVNKAGDVFVSWAFDQKIYFNKSTDGGLTWMKREKEIAKQAGGWTIDIPGLNRSNGMPVTVIDNSDGKYSGQLYVSYADQKSTDDTDLWIIKSKNEGRSWSKPVRITNDAVKTHQFLHWMAVDEKTGHIYIVYYNRATPDTEATDVYVAWSTDGASTWENVKISESPFTPVAKTFFGDYNNISAYDGVVRPIWTRYEDGKLSVWTAILEFQEK